MEMSRTIRIGRVRTPLYEAVGRFAVAAAILYVLWIQMIWNNTIILYCTIAISLVMNLLARRRIDMMGSVLLFISSSSIFSLIATDNISACIGGVSTLLKTYVLMVAVVNSCYMNNGFRVIRRATLLSALGLSTMLLVAGNDIIDSMTRVSVSEAVNENIIAITIVIGIYMALHELVHNKKRLIRAALYFACAYMITAVILTGTRKALIAVLALALGYFMFIQSTSSGRQRNSVKKLFWIIVGIAVAYYLFNYAMKNSMMKERFSNFGYAGDQNRLYYYRYAWKMFTESPFIGYGWAGFANRVGMYSHSTYGELVANTGILGTVLFLVVVIGIVKRSFTLMQKTENDTHKKALILSQIMLTIIMGVGIGSAIFYEMNLSLCIAVSYVMSKDKDVY